MLTMMNSKRKMQTDSTTCNSITYSVPYGCKWNNLYSNCQCPLRAQDIHLLYLIDISITAIPDQNIFNYISSFITDRQVIVEAQDIHLFHNTQIYPTGSILSNININSARAPYSPRSLLSDIPSAINNTINIFSNFPKSNARDVLIIFTGQQQSDYTLSQIQSICNNQYNITIIIYSYTINHNILPLDISCLIDNSIHSKDAYNKFDINSIISPINPFIDAKYSWVLQIQYHHNLL